MKRFAVAAALTLALAGCKRVPSALSADEGDGARLEVAATAAGLIPGKGGVTLAGRYERRSDVGIDRFCAVGTGDGEHRIGMVAMFGPESYCEATGIARIEGEAVAFVLDGKQDCGFTASFDGNDLQLPGSLPAGCASACVNRASLAGVSFHFVESGNAAAGATRGAKRTALCPSE